MFFIRWFTPAFGLSAWFNGLVIVSAVFQLACTLVPEVGGWKTRCHLWLAGLSAICLLPALLLLIFSDFISIWGKLLVALGAAAMATIIVLVVIKRGQRHALILQSAYFVAFFVPILGVSYL